ncbi:MAG: universal stress protein [Chloroflexota bacterium]|nr:universal stress protein [Chloroflexota bacterium]
MSDNENVVEYARAIEDFRAARAKARLQRLWASVTGKSDELLQYDEITRKMHVEGLSSKGIKEIPVEAIVGSVNRYQDFDRDFLPLRDEDVERWARVKAAMTTPGSPGLPPIRVYKIGEAYFVMDGNHRVSIAKQMGIEKLEAHVTEIKTKVQLSPDDSPEEIILKAEYTKFLASTRFDEIVPGVELKLTFPGQYETLEEHIHVHRHYMGLEYQREISWEEAVRHWFDQVYKPIVEIIRQQNILEEFPDKTETDLYIWVLDHQTYMQEELGWSIRPEKAAADLVVVRGRRFIRILQRKFEDFLRFLLPKQLEDFSKPGEWHAQKQIEKQNLFEDILLAIDGRAEGWVALEQAIVVAELEGSEIKGLIVEGKSDTGYLNYEDLERAFNERLSQSGINGNLVFARGKIAETILERAHFNDLIVLRLSHPPKPELIARLKSGMRTIIRQSTRPILVVREQVSAMNHLLLAYDGSAKGGEALFIGNYLCQKYHKHISLLVVSDDAERGKVLLEQAKEYLGDSCVSSIMREPTEGVSQTILDEAQSRGADMILMGGYGFPPLLEVFFGSTVDDVLRGTQIPVVICQ